MNDSSSVNWLCSLSIWQHYDKLIKRYLTLNRQSDLTKYSFALHFYHPVFSQWGYPNIQRPCKERLEKLDQNYYCFDLEDFVSILTSKLNQPIIRTIKIQTEVNNHFKDGEFFRPPTFGYFANMSNDTGVASGARININPLNVSNVDNKWLFKYEIMSDTVGTIGLRFQMKYSYHWEEDDEDEEEIEETIIPQTYIRPTRNTQISSSLRNPKDMKKIYPSLDLQKNVKNGYISKPPMSSNQNNKKLRIVDNTTLQKLNSLNG